MNDYIILLIISIALFVAIIVGIIIKIIKTKKKDLELERDDKIIMAILFIGSIFIMTSCSIHASIACNHYESYINNLLSIRNGSEVNGRFVLGVGHINEEQYYFYYYETEKGIKMGQKEVYNSYIVETNEHEPSLYEVKEVNEIQSYYRFYVPIGTVVRDFVLE